MQNALMETSQTRLDEWARVNDLLPWGQAPEWARFAFNYSGIWFWLENPPAPDLPGGTMVTGKARQIDPTPRILSTEHLFRRPGPPRVQSGITRLLMCDVPAKMAGKAGVSDDPEKAALRTYARVAKAARERFGEAFDEVFREVLDES